MNETRKLLNFVKPYWKRAAMALVLLTTLVFLDLSIPRLIQRLIDQGTHQRLLDRRGFYHHLYVSQFKGEAI